MGRIVICEPDPEVRNLLGLVVARMGRQPSAEANGAGDVDALIVEPADPSALAVALAVKARHPETPVVCTSIEPENGKTEALAPAAYLVKPFALLELEKELRSALLRARAPAERRSLSAD